MMKNFSQVVHDLKPPPQGEPMTNARLRSTRQNRHITDDEKIRLDTIFSKNLITMRPPRFTDDGRPIHPTAIVKWVNGYNDQKAADDCNKVKPMLPDGRMLPPLGRNSVNNYRSQTRGKVNEARRIMAAKAKAAVVPPPSAVVIPLIPEARRPIPIERIGEVMASAMRAEQAPVLAALAAIQAELVSLRSIWA